jgi:DNA-binding SARP family transcriptional activator
MNETTGGLGIRISVIGTFRVLSLSGDDLTPTGRKARGLLALLALAPDRRRSRAALQDKLWSDRAPEQGSASLRQTLTEVRRVLGRHRDCLTSDLRSVSLAPERVTVDLDTTDFAELAQRAEPPLLLDEVDVGDGEFESWIRNQRLAFEQRVRKAATEGVAVLQAAADLTRLEPPSRAAQAPRPWLRLLPPLVSGGESGAFLSRLVGDRIAQGMVDQWGVDISEAPQGHLGLQLRVEALAISRDACVRVALLTADGTVQLWSGSESIPLDAGFVSDSPRLQNLINRVIEVGGLQFRRLNASADGSQAFVNAFDAVQRMFKIDIGEVDQADALLAKAHELDPKGVFLAWRAYARTFYIGEHKVTDRDRVLGEAEMLARQALEADPHNATVLALASYVYSFAFRQYAVGHELASQSVKYNASHALGHAFLGRAKSYLGHHDDGYKLTCRGLELSGRAPYSYKLHFLCGVTALLSGRFEEAIRAAEIAYALAPTYRPPQRYVIPLYLRRDERAKAQDAYEKLRCIEPSFSLDAMRETTYPSTAIREAGLLNFSDRDL